MKHKRLRRLGALLLVFALAAPMGITTAWAAVGDGFAVTIEEPQDVSLNDLRSDVALSAETVGEVNNGTVTYRWSCDTGVVSISPTNSAGVTVSPIELGAGNLTVTATCTWKDSDNRTQTRQATAMCPVFVTSVPVRSVTFSGRQPTTMKTRQTHPASFHDYLVFNPDNATDTSVVWNASPSGIVTVDAGGWVTAQKTGKVTITARSVSNPTVPPAFCTLEVTDADTPEVTIFPAQEDIPASYLIGESFRLTATVTPATASSVTWSSSNKSVAEVDPATGVVVCKARGTATITASSKGINNKTVTDSRKVTVIDPSTLSATSIAPKGPTSLSLSKGEKTQLGVTVSPATANVNWASDNRAVVSVDPATGLATAVASGKANVTATAQRADGTPLTVKYEITVMGRPTGIEFNRTSDMYDDANNDGALTIRFDYSGGRTKTVYTTIRSENGEKTNTYIVWSTSGDTSILTAAAKGANGADLSIPSTRPGGRAILTATVYDNTTKQPVMVDEDTPLKAELAVVVSGITLSESALTMYEGEGKTLSIGGTYGEAVNSGAVTWTSSDSSIVSVENGSLSAWTKGVATVTVTKGNYSAQCRVTVTEDAGVVVSAGTVAAGNSIKLSGIASRLNAIAQSRVGANMDYISGIFISPNQGVVYNTYTSEADTGSGVSMAEKYYVNRTTPAPECIGALAFVGNKSYSGEARISYTGYAAGQPISGVITVNVNGMGEGNSDVTYTANACPVTFQADDFNAICNNKQGRSLKYVTFTPPQGSVGALYENYINETHTGQKVVSTTQYNRTGSPSLNDVTFVPAQGYSGTVRIGYRAVDSANSAYSGTVTINVTRTPAAGNPADIYYTAPQDGWATFRALDFSSASLRVIGETLSYVRFDLPDSSAGTLFYNYRGFGNYDSAVTSTTNYYRANSPALSGVTFVPATTAEGQSAIKYTGYSVRGTTFTGTVYVSEGTAPNRPGSDNTGAMYTVNSGSTVNLSVYDFNNACLSATGANLNYIQFNTLPAVGQGVLRCRTGSGSLVNNVQTGTQYFRTAVSNSAPLIGNITFQANAAYTGLVRIPYTGYNTNGTSFTGEVTIQVNPNTIVYTGTTASPIRLSSSRIRTACGAFTRDLSYIEFTSLPDASSGRLYSNYSGYGTGAQVGTGVRYYASSAPSIDQLSFVPKGRFQGDAVASYTAVSAGGEQMRGQIVFRISATGGSTYFNDMANYSWAAPSVDYLYQNGVTNGITATTYGPSRQILRRDFVLMLCRAFDFNGGGSSGFADVPSSAYYAQAVAAARRLGIVNGDGVNFMPDSQITRQDAMVMIKNAMVAAGKLRGTASTSVLNNFPDGAQVSAYARDAVSTLVQMGAVNGSGGQLNPRAPITRAEAAVILHFVMTA